MKRLFIYLSKSGVIDEESDRLRYVQVDYCLAHGCKPEDIVLVSNIPFSYNGVKSVIYHPRLFPPIANCVKAWFVAELYKNDVIRGTYWLTDLDLYQVSPLDRHSPVGPVDISVYSVETRGRVPHNASDICTCGIFISEKSLCVFERLRELSEDTKRRRPLSEERAAKYLHTLEPNLFTLLDGRYNLFAWNNLKAQYEVAEKPIIGVHFHPSQRWAAKMMCTSENSVGFPIAPEQLRSILVEHGFEHCR